MSWSVPRVLFWLGLCVGLALPALRPAADPVGAEALWRWAQSEGGDDLAHPAYIDATHAAMRLLPWHPGFRTARERIQRVSEARLDAYHGRP